MKKFIIQLHWCRDKYTNTIIYQNIFFDLKVNLFFLILKEINTCSRVPRSLMGPRQALCVLCPMSKPPLGHSPHSAPVRPGQEHTREAAGSFLPWSGSSPHSYPEAIQFGREVTAQEGGN